MDEHLLYHFEVRAEKEREGLLRHGLMTSMIEIEIVLLFSEDVNRFKMQTEHEFCGYPQHKN